MYPDTFSSILSDLKSLHASSTCSERAYALDTKGKDCIVLGQELTLAKLSFISQMLPRFGSKNLVIQGCPITAEQLEWLFETMNSTVLSALMLCDCDLQDDCADVLVAWIQKTAHKRHFFTIALSSNRFSTEGALKLIRACSGRVRFLDLSDNLISESIVLPLTEMIKQKELPFDLALNSNLLSEQNRAALIQTFQDYIGEKRATLRLENHVNSNQPIASVDTRQLLMAWMDYVIRQWNANDDDVHRANLIHFAKRHIFQIAVQFQPRHNSDIPTPQVLTLPLLSLYRSLLQEVNSPFDTLMLFFPDQASLPAGEHRQTLFAEMIALLKDDIALRNLTLNLREFTNEELVKISEVIGKSRRLQTLRFMESLAGQEQEECFLRILASNDSITKCTVWIQDRPNDVNWRTQVALAFKQNLTLLELKSEDGLKTLFEEFRRRNRRIASRDHNKPWRPEYQKELSQLQGTAQKRLALSIPSLKELAQASRSRTEKPKQILDVLIQYLKSEMERYSRVAFSQPSLGLASASSTSDTFTNLLTRALKIAKMERISLEVIMPLVKETYEIAKLQGKPGINGFPLTLIEFREKISSNPETWETVDEEAERYTKTW